MTSQPLYSIASTLDAGQIASIRAHEQVILLFGPGATAWQVTAALNRLAGEAPGTHCQTIVVSAPELLADFQPLIDADRLFYLASGELSERQLEALIDGARVGSEREGPADLFLPADALRRMALAESVAEVADAVTRTIGGVTGADRGRCLLYDREQDVLWTSGHTDDDASAAVGVVSFVLRTGTTVCLPRLAGDPRADLSVDNPGGTASDRFVAVPVRAARGVVVAVLVAVRPQHDPPFEPRDVAILEALAAHAGPYLGAWLVPAPASPFRDNALQNLDQALEGREPLRLEQAWERSTPWLAAATFSALLLALAVALGLHHG